MPAQAPAKPSTASLKAEPPNPARLARSLRVATLAILLALPALAAGVQADPAQVQPPPQPAVGPEDLDQVVALTLAYIASFDPTDDLATMEEKTTQFLLALASMTGKANGSCLEFHIGLFITTPDPKPNGETRISFPGWGYDSRVHDDGLGMYTIRLDNRVQITCSTTPFVAVELP